MRLSSDPGARLDRALLSLEGLSVGDGFGERFFAPESVALLEARIPPPGPWRTTDDTEMALGIVEVLARTGKVVREELARVFGERYVRDPWRGYGGAAHRILQAIADGMPWRGAAAAAFGGLGSMGNGAAMRVAPLGAYFADDLGLVLDEARASAEVTHAHPEGQAGAIAVAVAAAWVVRDRTAAPASLLAATAEHVPPGETRQGIVRALEIAAGTPIGEVAAILGNGSGAIAADTVPLSLWCAAHHLGDFEEALWTTAAAGGDCDTTCAIVGGLVALATGAAGIPDSWRGAREPLAVAVR
ncbi:ADP-ribosylglycohydrolase family protein [Vulgatibacter sp.]|uniref:ADP-ribosylglycohydrolase family protein n=1 Tax=Vulgatibacter sp. TaxID=1971226 RepID=UPI00356B0D52